MPINNSTIRSSVWVSIYDTINSNLSDPFNRNKQWIFSNFPSIDDSFCGYPIITVSRISLSKEYPLFDNSFSDKGFTISIAIYSTKAALVDTLSDSLDTIMTPLIFDDYVFVEYSESNATTIINGQSIHYRILNYTFDIEANN